MVEKLGFTIEKYENLPYMKPPAGGLLKIFDLINHELDINIAKKLLTERDVLRPAIFFTRVKEEKIEYFFHTLNQNVPFPSKKDGWVLFTSETVPGKNKEEISAEAFNQALSEGKFPLGPVMWHHDIGHFTEMITYPKYAKLIKDFASQRYKKGNKNKSLSYTFRSYIALEASATVNLDYKDAIVQFQKDFFNTSSLNLENIKHNLRTIEKDVQNKLFNQFISIYNNWIVPQGGGARDIFNRLVRKGAVSRNESLLYSRRDQIDFKYNLYDRALLDLFRQGKLKKEVLTDLIGYLKPEMLDKIKKHYGKKDLSFEAAISLMFKHSLSRSTTIKQHLDNGLNSLLLMSQQFEVLQNYQETLSIRSRTESSPLVPKKLFNADLSEGPLNNGRLNYIEGTSAIFLENHFERASSPLDSRTKEIIINEILIDLFARIQIGMAKSIEYGFTHDKFAELILENKDPSLKNYFASFAYEDSILWQLFVDKIEPIKKD